MPTAAGKMREALPTPPYYLQIIPFRVLSPKIDSYNCYVPETFTIYCDPDSVLNNATLELLIQMVTYSEVEPRLCRTVLVAHVRKFITCFCSYLFVKVFYGIPYCFTAS